jgi:hypothetical protein
MEVRAVGLLTCVELPAAMYLEVEWMVFLFFPAVREFASILMFAAICVSLDKVLSLPLGALLFFIFEYVRFSPEVLPIVCVYA